MTESYRRKLTAILHADVQGYTRMMAEDEETTLRTLTAYRKVMTDSSQQYNGRVIDSTGDSVLAEFGSAVDAVRCALAIQNELKMRNAELSESRRMEFRIGANLGDVIEEGDRIYGDGVNVAERVGGLAEASGICITGSVYDQVKGKLSYGYEYIGEQSVKNILEPIRVYRVMPEVDSPRGASVEIRDRKWFSGSRLISIAAVVIVLAGVAVYNWFGKQPRDSLQSQTLEQKTATTPSEKPVIAVLPFDNMSGDPEQEYFSNGITEEIITRLSMNSALTVIARNSTFHYKGKGPRIQQVGQELGARYVVEGSVRKAGDMVRITAQLIDATTENHLWAETYERELKDIFALQDDISQQIVAALSMKGWQAEQERAWRNQAENPTAYDHAMRGWWHYYNWTKEDNAKAKEMFKKAIDLDPAYAAGYVGMGQSYVQAYHSGYNPDPELLDHAMKAAQNALQTDPSEPLTYLLLTDIYWRKGQWEQALVEIDKGIDLNQSFVDAIYFKGFILRNLGRHVESIEYFEKAIQLDPMNRELPILSLSITYRIVGRYRESLEGLSRIISHTADPSQPGRAFCEIAITYLQQWKVQENEDPDALNKAFEMAQKSVDLEEKSPCGHHALCLAHLNRRTYDQAITEAEKAIAINAGWSALLGHVYNFVGRSEEAIPLAKQSIQIAPEGPGALGVLAHAFSLTKRNEDAVATYQKVLESNPDHSTAYDTHVSMAILYSESGRIEQAKGQVQEILKKSPNFSVDVWGERNPMIDRQQVKRDMAALRKAGLK